MENSEYPDVANSLLAIAGHSGNGRNAFFTNLNKLTTSDLIFIYYNGIKYIYYVTEIYEVDKNGTININRNYDKKTLVLTTCSEEKDSKQLVVKAEVTEEVVF